MGPEVLPSNELTREEAFLAEFQRWIVSNYPEDNPHRKIEIEYFRRAEFFAQRLNFKSAPAIGIAIFSRAVERVFLSSELDYTPSEYLQLCRIETIEKSSVRKVVAFLREQGASRRFIDDVNNLSRNPDENYGAGRTRLLRSALRISFLEGLAPLFISWVPEGLDRGKVEGIIELMYDRISLPRAREMAEPFYLGAEALLRKRMARAQHQALADYWEIAKKEWHSGRQIDALRKAADRALSFKGT